MLTRKTQKRKVCQKKKKRYKHSDQEKKYKEITMKESCIQ